MTSVLHPVGPEPSQTYWVRRVLVIAAAVVALMVITTLMVNAGGGRTAVPGAPPSTQAPTMAPSPSDFASGLTPTGSPSAPANGSTSPTSSASSSAEPTTGPTETPTAAPTRIGPADCQSSKLRATLTGKSTLREKQGTQFRLSLINGSTSTCLVSVTAKTFELKIYSGTDRIWSSRDCSTAVKRIARHVDSEKAVEWTMSWNGRRSRANCQQRPEIPKPGTYFATAQLAGAKPVQLRMIIHG